jgi:site-specific DNA-methyltransferase (adenine-specific)
VIESREGARRACSVAGSPPGVRSAFGLRLAGRGREFWVSAMKCEILQGDCLERMRAMDAQSVDLVFGSPPYEVARTYGIDFSLKGQAWVDWMVEVFKASLHVSRGLVAMVLEGQTQKFRWTATPALLMADLHRAGIHLRKPPLYHRVGIPGSGGPDWLRNDYEFIVCATNGGKLPWSDNTAMASPCRHPIGGAMSNRAVDGQRRNAKTGSRLTKTQTRRKPNGERSRDGVYTMPKLANPGNIVHCKVGGGAMGGQLCHDNEAPFPEKLAEFFIRSFCPPGGTVLDPFSGSGTTAKVAIECDRNAVGIDIRESQVQLSRRRVAQVQRQLA